MPDILCAVDIKDLHSTVMSCDCDLTEGRSGAGQRFSFASHQIWVPLSFLWAVRLKKDDFLTACTAVSSNVSVKMISFPLCQCTERFLAGATFTTSHCKGYLWPSIRGPVWLSLDTNTLSGISAKKGKMLKCIIQRETSSKTPANFR